MSAHVGERSTTLRCDRCGGLLSTTEARDARGAREILGQECGWTSPGGDVDYCGPCAAGPRPASPVPVRAGDRVTWAATGRRVHRVLRISPRIGQATIRSEDSGVLRLAPLGDIERLP